MAECTRAQRDSAGELAKLMTAVVMRPFTTHGAPAAVLYAALVLSLAFSALRRVRALAFAVCGAPAHCASWAAIRSPPLRTRLNARVPRTSEHLEHGEFFYSSGITKKPPCSRWCTPSRYVSFRLSPPRTRSSNSQLKRCAQRRDRGATSWAVWASCFFLLTGCSTVRGSRVQAAAAQNCPATRPAGRQCTQVRPAQRRAGEDLSDDFCCADTNMTLKEVGIARF